MKDKISGTPSKWLSIVASAVVLTGCGAPLDELENLEPSSEVELELTPSTPERQALKAEFTKINTDVNAVGLSYAVQAINGQRFGGGMGVANLAKKTPVTSSTRINAASVSKMFTGTAIAIAISEKRLPSNFLDLRVGDINSPTAKKLSAGVGGTFGKSAKDIRIKDLLGHTAGLSLDFPRVEGHAFPWSLLRGWNYKSFAPSEKLMATIPQLEMKLPPGKGVMKYSNVGNVLAANIAVELMDGNAPAGGDKVDELGAILKTKVFVPRKMNNSSYRRDSEAYAPTTKKASNYSLVFPDGPAANGGRNRVPSPADMGGYAPAIGVVSSSADLTKMSHWLARVIFQLQPAPSDLRARLLASMEPNVADSSARLRTVGGFTLWRDVANDDVIVGHAGFHETATTFTGFSLRHGVAVSVQTNSDGPVQGQFRTLVNLAAQMAKAEGKTVPPPADVVALVDRAIAMASAFKAPDLSAIGVTPDPQGDAVETTEVPAKFKELIGTYHSGISASLKVFWAQGGTEKQPKLGLQFGTDPADAVLARSNMLPDGRWIFRFPSTGGNFKFERVVFLRKDGVVTELTIGPSGYIKESVKP